MQKLKFLLLFGLVLLLACNKSNTLITPSDFLSRDDTDTNILREYKTWIVNEATIEIPGKTTLMFKKGQAIQGNFDPSKIGYVFNSNKSYQGTNEKGVPESGSWAISEDGKTLTINGSSVIDIFNILQLNRTNLDISNQVSYDTNTMATVTIKFVPNR